MKFFKWNIETKIKRLDADKRILYLANRLIKEIKGSGRDTTFEKDGQVVMPVTLSISVHKHYKPARLYVECGHHGWEVHGDYKE